MKKEKRNLGWLGITAVLSSVSLHVESLVNKRKNTASHLNGFTDLHIFPAA